MIKAAEDCGVVPVDHVSRSNLIFYSRAEDAVYKALGVEWKIYA